MQYKVEIAQISPSNQQEFEEENCQTSEHIDKFGDFGIFAKIKFGDFGIFTHIKFGDFGILAYFCTQNINIICQI